MIWIILVLIALFIAIFKEIIKKKILDGIKPIEFVIIFYSFMFIFAQITLSYVMIPKFSEFILIILASLCYLMANMFGLRALKEMRISVFKPVSGISSFFVLIFAYLFLKESINIVQSIGLLLILIPIIYLAILEYHHKEIDKLGLFHLIMAMLFESGAIIFDRIILRSLNTFTYFYFLKLTLIIMFVITLYFFYDFKINVDFIKKKALAIGSLALITMIGTYSYFTVLKNPMINTGVIKTILSSSIVFTTVIGGMYFKEDHLLLKTAITVISLAGIVLLILF